MTNAPPMITVAGAASVPENQTAAIDVQATDDIDAEGNGLLFSKTGGVDQELFHLDADTGELTFISSPDFEAPADAGADNSYNVQVTVTDSGGLSDVQDFTISLTPVNDNAPVLASIGNQTVNQGMLLSFTATATDADLPGDTLTFSLGPGAPAGANIDVNTGVFTMPANTPGVFPVTVRVSDNGTPAIEDFEMFEITVQEVPAAPVGPERLVNDVTVSFQVATAETRAVDANAAGDYIVGYSGRGSGDLQGVYVQRYDASDNPQGPVLLVNETTSGNQRNASVAIGDDGESVVAWNGTGTGDNDGGVFVRLIGGLGVLSDHEIRVNQTIPSFQHRPNVAKAPDGSFVVVWSGKGPAGDFDSAVMARRFAADGMPLSGEFRVNTTTSGYQQQPDVAVGSDGRFTVAWAGNGIGDLNGVFLQRYDSSGAAVGGETRVNTTVSGMQLLPSIGMDGSNNIVIAWSGTGVGDSRGVFVRRFDSDGNPLGNEELVNTQTLYDQEDASVSVSPSGLAVVTWTSLYQDGSQRGVYGQEYDLTGAKLGGEFLVNTTTGGDQKFSTVAMKGELGFVATWSGRGDGDLNGVFTRSFNRPVSGVAGAPGVPSALSAPAVDQLMSDDEDEFDPLATTLF